MKGVSVREMEAAKQIMAAYGKWEKYLSEWRHDSDIPESYHTGIRENSIRPGRYCICLRKAHEIIPWERNVQEHDHQARGQRQRGIDLRNPEDRSVLGRDDGFCL